MKSISLITLNYNSAKTIEKFVKSVQNFSNIDHILVVDNESTDNSLPLLKKLCNSKVQVISSGSNNGYGYGNNCGIDYVNKNFKSDYIIIANPDVVFHESTVDSLYQILDGNPKLLMASTVMENSQRVKQKNTAWKVLPCFKFIINEGAIIHRLLKLDQYKNLFISKEKVKVVDCLAGSFFMIKNNKSFTKNLYDESMFLYCEENYLGIKLKQMHYKAAILLNDYYVHSHGETINKFFDKTKQDKMIFNNEIYLMKNYMNASKSMIRFAKAFFSFCIVERAVFRLLFR